MRALVMTAPWEPTVTHVHGPPRQDSTTADMIFPVGRQRQELVSAHT